MMTTAMSSTVSYLLRSMLLTHLLNGASIIAAEVDDEDVEKYCEGVITTSETSYMCGFVAYVHIPR